MQSHCFPEYNKMGKLPTTADVQFIFNPVRYIAIHIFPLLPMLCVDAFLSLFPNNYVYINK